jgi:hypothetical protein
MEFFEFCRLASSAENVLSYLRQEGVLRTTYRCVQYHGEMSTQRFARSLDEFVFRCSKCKTQKSICSESFLVDCKLSLPTFASLFYLLQADVQFKTVAKMLEIKPHTVSDYANLLCKECSRDLIEHRQLLGGPGRRVQIDESLLARAKVSRNHQARPVREQWVFGAYDVEAKIGWIKQLNKETL